MSFGRPRSLRDVTLILMGATAMYFTSTLFHPFTIERSAIVSTQVDSSSSVEHVTSPFSDVSSYAGSRKADTHRDNRVLFQEPIKSAPEMTVAEDVAFKIPETTILSHAPGWTVFRNLYMSNGTIYIVTSQPNSFPEIVMMTSTGLLAENTPENIAMRIPTSKDMTFLTPAEAVSLWGGDVDRLEKNRIWSVPGNTFIVNEPSQFLGHYYHFCAEWLFGAWAFWQGAWNAVVNAETAGRSSAPPVHRTIFANAPAGGWRDGPGFNSYVFRSAFPSLTVEVSDDWDDRIAATSNKDAPRRAWHFEAVLFSDRSASFKGAICGSQTQRIAAEATEHMRLSGNLTKLWWEPVRRGVLSFAGVDERTLDIGVKAQTLAEARKTFTHPAAGGHSDLKASAGMLDKDIVITYISRQSSRRHLLHDDHVALVKALEDMSTKHGWELNVIRAETLTKEQQLAIAARTTVLLGVHGNGLTHLIMMPVTPVSTVIEIFYPQGFAHDYQWTTHALGMRHFGIWNDTFFTMPNKPQVAYPDGFQGTEIPVYPPIVVRAIEERIAGLHPM